jgi:hypothetical protein
MMRNFGQRQGVYGSWYNPLTWGEQEGAIGGQCTDWTTGERVSCASLTSAEAYVPVGDNEIALPNAPFIPELLQRVPTSVEGVIDRIAGGEDPKPPSDDPSPWVPVAGGIVLVVAGTALYFIFRK